MLFCKCGCLIGFENRIFRKSFSFDRKKEALTTEIHFRSYFHFKWFSEREREREEEEGVQITPSTSPTNPELQSDNRTHQIAPVSSIATPRRSHSAARSRLRSRLRTISPSTQSLRPTDFRSIDLSLSVILISV